MTWAGLDTTTLLQAAGALFVSLLLLHLLRVRRRRVVVAHAALWFDVTTEGRANSLLRRLRRLWSFLLLLGIGGAMVASLGDPQPTTDSVLGFAPAEIPPTRHTMILLDASASMDTLERGETRFERSAKRAHELVDRLSTNPQHRVMVATVGRRITPLTLWTRDGESAHGAIDDALAQGPLDQRLDVGGVNSAVRTILSGLEQAEAVMLTDGAFDHEGLDLSFRASVVGERMTNVSMEAFNVRPALDGSASYAIFAAVRNHTDAPIQATLLLYAQDGARAVEDFVSPDRIVSSHGMTLPPDSVHREVLTDILFSGDRLAARVVLDPQEDAIDGLARDDVAVALVPARRPLRVQLVGKENLFLSASLLTLEGVDLDVRSAEQYEGPRGYDVSVIHGVDVDMNAPGNYLLVNPPPGAVIQHKRRLARPQIGRVDRHHPITRGLEIVDAAIERATHITAAKGDRAVVRTTGGQPLVFTRRLDDGARRFVVFAFAPEESLLPLRYAFPLMMVQSLGWFAPQEGGLVPTRRAGAALSVATELPAGNVRLRGPEEGRPASVRRIGDRLHFVGERVGIYEFTHEEGDETELVALNLMDAAESRLNARASVELYVPPAVWQPKPPPWPGTPWRLLLLIAGALLAVEWWTWHRRVTA